MTSFRVFHEWAKAYGPVYRVRFLWRPVVVVTDPDLYQPLLRSGPAKLQKYTAPYKMFEVFVKPPRSNMLSSAETPVWKASRRAAVAALTMNNLRLCFPHITAVSQRLIDSLAAAGPDAVHDVDLLAQQITVDVIGMAAFGRDLEATVRRPQQQQQESGAGGNSTASSSKQGSSSGGGGSGRGISGRGGEVLEVMRHLVVAMQARNNPLNRWFPWRKAPRDLMYWGGRMSDLVLDLTADMEAAPPPPHSLGAHMLAARLQGSGEPLERLQVMTELGVLWGAGFETTAHTICWTLLLVATHPAVEAALLAELAGLGLAASPEAPQPGQIKWEHLAQLRYLSAVINESMRLYPVVSSGTIRITHKPMRLGPYSLPAGQPVLIPFFSIHRSPRLWQDPDEFRPERWLAGEEAAAAAAAAAGQTAAAAGTGSASSGPDESAAEGEASAAAAAAAAAATPAIVDDDYVDVAADISAMRDQLPQEQQQQQQQDISKGSKGQLGTSRVPVQQQDAAPAAAAKPGGSGLEIKDPSVSRRGFLPFSEGSRNCVGQALALVELKAVLALLLGNFAFRLAPEMGGLAGVDADARLAITLRPEHGMLMSLRHRSSAS
ncbi:hypothetical protein OEZ86_011354 [Tetradesmus obliquus]|nr:hypothetical protein OEZ86_011354 [Tetradesmus obliquus]